jgi:hypothetical protein
MSAAERELGYRPVTTYSEAVGETIEWLTAELRRASWRDWLPGFTVEYLGGYFDYAAEDEFLAALSGS